MNNRRLMKIVLIVVVIGLGVYFWHQWQSGPDDGQSRPVPADVKSKPHPRMPVVMGKTSVPGTGALSAEDGNPTTNPKAASPAITDVPADTNIYYRLEGKVVHAWDGTPIGNAQIKCEISRREYTTNSCADGSFVLERVKTGILLRLGAKADGFEPKAIRDFPISSDITGILIPLIPKWGDIQGRVINRLTGEPVTNAVVSCFPLERGHSHVSANDGTFNLQCNDFWNEFSLFPNISFVLFSAADGFQSRLVGEDGSLVLARRQSITNLLIALEPDITATQECGYIQGLAQYDDGVPATDLTVELQPFDEPISSVVQTLCTRTNLDQNGQFQFRLPADVYRIKLAKLISDTPGHYLRNGVLERPVTVKAGETTSVLLSVPRPGILRLNFLDSAGQPYLLGCNIVIKFLGRDSSITVKKGNSSYDLSTMKPGNYFFYFTGNDRSMAGPCEIEVATGRKQELNIMLSKGPMVIHGSVKDKRDLSPVKKALIVFSATGMEQTVSLPATKTGADGEFSQSLPEGDGYVVSYSIEHADYFRESGQFTVKSGGQMAPLTILLKKSARLEVRVVGLERLTCSLNETITILMSRPNESQSTGIFLSDLINQKGLMSRFGQLSEGKADVEVRIGDRNGKVIGHKSVEIKNTETNLIEIQVADAP